MSGRAQQPGGKTFANLMVGEWVREAACQGCDPDTFYPPEIHGKRTRNVLAGDATLAKLICRECPVQVECLRFALDHAEPWGVWGGLTAAERTKLRTGPPPINHGTEAGCAQHRRRGEQPCRACLIGAARASRERRERRTR